MNPWNVVAGGAVIGFIAGFWEKIKAILWRIANLFVQQVEIPANEAHEALVSYLIAKMPRSRIYDRLYGAAYEYQRDGRYALVPYEVYGNRSLVFWNGWFPFVFSNQREKPKPGRGGEQSTSEATKIVSTLTFVRGMLDFDQLLRDACAERNHLSWNASEAEEAAKSRFCIHFVPKRVTENEDQWGWGSGSNGLAWYQQGHYRLLAHTPDQLGKAATGAGKALEHLIFPQKVKDLIQEIELWRKSRGWYHDKGIPWKRGWLLYGPPGTGKTALARAFAEDLNMPIYVFNLAEMGNPELIRAWNEMQVNVPCIALIEDVDNVFHGRENVARKNGYMNLLFAKKSDDDKGDRMPSAPLTFDCLLNCLDGVERSDGIFTIVTTNDLSKIDPALGQPRKLPDGSTEFISTRPGRIDKAVELTYMETDDKKRMAQRILSDYPDEYAAMLEFIEQFPDLQETPAQFQERCGQVALQSFWREQKAAELREKASVADRPAESPQADPAATT
jgi:hypothetical protein